MALCCDVQPTGFLLCLFLVDLSLNQLQLYSDHSSVNLTGEIGVHFGVSA